MSATGESVRLHFAEAGQMATGAEVVDDYGLLWTRDGDRWVADKCGVRLKTSTLEINFGPLWTPAPTREEAGA